MAASTGLHPMALSSSFMNFFSEKIQKTMPIFLHASERSRRGEEVVETGLKRYREPLLLLELCLSLLLVETTKSSNSVNIFHL